MRAFIMSMGPWALGPPNIHSNVGSNTPWENGLYSKRWGCFFANKYFAKMLRGERRVHNYTQLHDTLKWEMKLWGEWVGNKGNNGWGIERAYPYIYIYIYI